MEAKRLKKDSKEEQMLSYTSYTRQKYCRNGTREETLERERADRSSTEDVGEQQSKAANTE